MTTSENRLTRVMAIGSFAVHGTASLKTLITLLGDKILPVPSLLLNGLTNMALVKKFEIPFAELLQSTFELAVNRKLSLILYIGYLGNAEQGKAISEMIATYRSHIKTIIVDPVCGDHGRIYVPEAVIAQWPQLIKHADMVFPNLTELKVLTGNIAENEQPVTVLAEQFKQLYPDSLLVVTSIKNGDLIGIHSFGSNPFSFYHAELPRNFGGSGDAFLGLFILNHFFAGYTFNHSLKYAAMQTQAIINNTIVNDCDDLIIGTLPKFDL